ncbi:AGE family epimerase/isomerase [Shewanella sp.]|uniref:AGE family epimerase/isomerase n=1 Tax=Shewanella sp. TaxID=50422 RepID=UPI0035668839
MNFYSRDFLLSHSQSILDFYDPRVLDASGGYFHNYYDDGSLFDPGFRQLVSSCRIIVNYARAADILDTPEYLAHARHGLDYLLNVHLQADERFAWTLRDHQSEDMTQQAYGYAFVLLAFAACRKTGILEDNEKLLWIYNLLEQRFWQPEYGLYADEISAEGVLSDYRGQNANMHLCEAMIAAFEASGEGRFLDRAMEIADKIANRQAALTGGIIWEHFTPEFAIDWDYNKDDPKNLYRPWGFQGGHQTEWAKLLLSLARYSHQPWLISRAKTLFDTAFEKSWDQHHGGMVYGFGPDGNWCDDDKYFWVQAESFAAAAMLYQQTGEQQYLDAYNALWDYAWQHFVDHEHGAWFRVLYRDNRKYSNEKSAAGAKCDYHTLGACFDSLTDL